MQQECTGYSTIPFFPPADERSELRLVISVKMIPRNSLMSLFLPKLNDFLVIEKNV